MNKKIGLLILIVLIICLGFWVSNMNPATENTIRVGIIAPLTGTAASYGTEGRNSVVLALDEINANGGIKGHKIEYFIEDGKCEAKAALDAWNKLVNINKVKVVFGGHCGTESVTIAPMSAKDKVLVLSVFASVLKIENEGEWFFRDVSTNSYYATQLAHEAYKQGYRNVSVVTEQKEFPVSYSDTFISEFKKLGGNILADERFTPETTDFRAIGLKMKNIKNDSVLISTQGPQTMGLVAKQFKELEIEKPTMFNHAFSYKPFSVATNNYIPKDFLVVAPVTDSTSPKVKEFNEKYQKKYNSLYNFNTYYITADYDIVYRFKEAGKECIVNGVLDIDCVRNKFKTATSFSGVSGDMIISSEYAPHSVITPIGTLKIVEGKEVLEPIK